MSLRSQLVNSALSMKTYAGAKEYPGISFVHHLFNKLDGNLSNGYNSANPFKNNDPYVDKLIGHSTAYKQNTFQSAASIKAWFEQENTLGSYTSIENKPNPSIGDLVFFKMGKSGIIDQDLIGIITSIDSNAKTMQVVLADSDNTYLQQKTFSYDTGLVYNKGRWDNANLVGIAHVDYEALDTENPNPNPNPPDPEPTPVIQIAMKLITA